MILLNFSHPLPPEQVARLEELVQSRVEQVLDVAVQFDPEARFEDQMRSLIEGVPLTAVQWQMEAILVSLPSFHVIAALLLAELHGRMGYFPPVVRMKPVPGSTPTRFEVAEVINLQTVRDRARRERKS